MGPPSAWPSRYETPPIFEDKVIDFLVELAKVTEKQVSRDELFKDDAEEKNPPPAE
jgi:hypothetical protein